jgi:hypothetical protein
MRTPLQCTAWLVFALAVAWLPAATRAEGHEDRESGPELILPGDHVVQPGEWIELRWTRADRISEMEILLSEDGGRHYSVCISPQLDPGACGFRWRVPETGGDLRMRIRFNRGGREIEGAPSAPLRVAAGESGPAQPLGLPPLDATGSSRLPRAPGQRSDGQGGRATQGVMGGRQASDPAPVPSTGPASMPAPDPATPQPPADAMPFAAPRLLPLRS